MNYCIEELVTVICIIDSSLSHSIWWIISKTYFGFTTFTLFSKSLFYNVTGESMRHNQTCGHTRLLIYCSHLLLRTCCWANFFKLLFLSCSMTFGQNLATFSSAFSLTLIWTFTREKIRVQYLDGTVQFS